MTTKLKNIAVFLPAILLGLSGAPLLAQEGESIEEAETIEEVVTGLSAPSTRCCGTCECRSHRQACSYKVGMIKILELRERAKAQLGDDFDIRKFHNIVLSGGDMPLEILEGRVDAWLADPSSV